MIQQERGRGGMMGTIIGLATVAFLAVIIYFVLKGFIWFIFAFAWVFLIVAVIFDYKVIINFGKRLLALFKTNPLYGVGAAALSVLLHPFLFFILMLRALGSKFVKKIGFDLNGQPTVENGISEEFAEYEEILDEELDLKQIEFRKRGE